MALISSRHVSIQEPHDQETMLLGCSFSLLIVNIMKQSKHTSRVFALPKMPGHALHYGFDSKHAINNNSLVDMLCNETKIFASIQQTCHPSTLLFAYLFTATAGSCAFDHLHTRAYPQIAWSAILVVSAIFMAVKSIPIGVPFEVGLPEITLTTLLYFFVRPWAGTDSNAIEISATATILMRLLTLWLRFFIGFAAQQWIGIKALATTTESKTEPS